MQIYLAPMEGVTGYVLRNAFRRHFGGIDKYFTPFIPAAKRLNYKIKRDLLPENNTGIRLVPQLISNQAAEILDMTAQLQEFGYREFNLNLGCPSGTVVSKNRGSGLLRCPEDLDRFLDGVYSQTPFPVSVKTRIGFDSLSEWPGLLDIFARYPMAEFIIHPRLRREQYGGFPHLDAFGLAYERFYGAPSNILHSGAENSANASFPASESPVQEINCSAPERLVQGNSGPSYAAPELRTKQSENTGHSSQLAPAPKFQTKLCYNGDLWDMACVETIRRRFPALDTMMIGRGLLARPALACRIKGIVFPEEELRTRLRSFCEEIFDGYLSIFDGEKDAVMRMKEIWCSLRMSFESSDPLVKKLLKCQTGIEYRAMVSRIFDTLELVPYEPLSPSMSAQPSAGT